jgi:hypothetical protein
VAAHITMQSAHELGKVIPTRRDNQVLVVLDEHAMVDGDAGVPLGVSKRVEPALLHHRNPRAEEGLAQRRATRDRGRSAGNDHPRRGHRDPAAQRAPC